jgi:tRNA/rRNA methyltransferase
MTQPSHPGNVGSTARAIKTMGFEDLALVSPKLDQISGQPEAIALASGALDVLQNAPILTSLAEALAPVTLAFALTARPRDLGPPSCDIRQAAGLARTHLAQHPEARVAIVAGTERSGLTNEQIALCHRVCYIPANPDYSSLNVSQALQLAAWELRYALLSEAAPSAVTLNVATPITHKDPGRKPASSQAVQALILHLEEALVAVQFLDPDHPKKLMPRMRHLFSKLAMTQDEVDMWRGVCTAMITSANKARGQQDTNLKEAAS